MPRDAAGAGLQRPVRGVRANLGLLPQLPGGTRAVSRYELPLPCNHASSKWAFRISSHTDEQVDAADAGHVDGDFCSVWVCARSECVERGKRYVASVALCTPVVIDGVAAELDAGTAEVL